MGVKSANQKRFKPQFLLFIPSAFFAAYYLFFGKFIEAILVSGVGFSVSIFAGHVSRKTGPKKVDLALTTAIFHMYSLSMGETSPDDLVRTIAESKEYGFYSKVFEKIFILAKNFGYGFTKATAHVAESLRPPLKDILIRLTSVLSSVKPRGYLEIESSMLIEEYSGYYTRSIEALKTLGGIFASFQSVTVFLIMTIAIMAMFMVDPNIIVFGYFISAFSIITLYFLFRAASPKEDIIYIGRYPPKSYILMRLTFFAVVPISVAVAVMFYLFVGVPVAFIVLGLGVILPGIFGYMLERYVNRIDREYPAFLKAIGENMASTLDLKAAFSYVLDLELGPLKALVKNAWNRLRLGIGNAQTMENFSSETASYLVHVYNRIFLDAVARGANPLEVGNSIGNRAVKLIEFRKARNVVTNGFQMIVMVMQPLTVLLLVVTEVLVGFMSQYLVTLPYFGFNAIPMPIVHMGNTVLVSILAVVNAMTIREVSAGYWGTFLLNLGILLIVSGVTWMVASYFIQTILSSMPTLELTFPTA